MPSSVPWRRRSKGSAASSTLSSVAAAPVARKPAPIHSSSCSPVTLSAPITTTRRQRPERIQSSARLTAWAVLAQAALTRALGPAGADVLGELAVAHGQHTQQVAAVEAVLLARDPLVELAEPAVDLAQRLRVARVHAQVVERLALALAALVREEPPGLVGEAVVAREGAREDHARVVAHRLGQQPALGQVLARRRLLVGLDQWNAGLAQGVQAGGHGQLGRDVEGLDELVGDAVLRGEVEGAGPARPA